MRACVKSKNNVRSSAYLKGHFEVGKVRRAVMQNPSILSRFLTAVFTFRCHIRRYLNLPIHDNLQRCRLPIASISVIDALDMSS
jgi:hypothetical protein